jgi:ATPase components of ABC transporters with duplicated ATPase domains
VFRKATYTQFLALQEEYNAQREREARALRDELDRKMAFVERFRAKATKARQAGSRQKMAKKLEKELEDYRPEPKRKELNFSWPEAPHSEKVVMAAADLDFHFGDGKTMNSSAQRVWTCARSLTASPPTIWLWAHCG